MANYPVWTDMTAEQKFEFLYEWCGNMAQMLQKQGAWMNELQKRLDQVESRVGGGGS